MLILVKPTTWDTEAAGLAAGVCSCAKAAIVVVKTNARAIKRDLVDFINVMFGFGLES
jgi:hypothetical protein